ncbi:hypothetical protein DEO72_LG7g1371 [Vigna unguiculata]|uniref:Uncharacterized protein n=1 Tax=Vigna unguiculata TaxID=3917 RepID=A0A4D6MK41_VIGUN|nr:hypothetical protein DEO72_LG7g1371 [Vigna unguiculata]
MEMRWLLTLAEKMNSRWFLAWCCCGRDGGVSWDAVVLRKSSRRRLRDGGGASRWLPALQVKVVGGCHG